MNQRHEDKADHWMIDKRVPVAIILALLVQTGTFIWWASGINTRVEMLERGAVISAPQAERVIRLEENMKAIQLGIADIKADLKSLIRPPTRMSPEQ